MAAYVLHLIANALLFASGATLASLCILYGYLYWHKKDCTKQHMGKLGCVVFYIFALYHITIIRNGIVWDRIGTASVESIQWKPIVELVSILQNSLMAFLYNVIGNILWFVPIGILGSYVFRSYSLVKAMVLGCLVSMSIEILQFILVSGISDVDDILLNTIGAMAGYGLYCLYQKKKYNVKRT